MKKWLWKVIGRFVARPAVANWLIRQASKTPYMHLPTNEDPSYMERHWLFNPYSRVTNKPRYGWFFPWSIRVHHIKREDYDRALHDHPWNARTFILKGWYVEKRLNPKFKLGSAHELEHAIHVRRPGDTAKLGHNEYHTICEVSEGGVFTLFISGPWQGVWGFLVNGVKVEWRKYLADQAEARVERLLRKYELNVTYGKFGKWVKDTACTTCNDTGRIQTSEPYGGSNHQPPESDSEPCDMCAQHEHCQFCGFEVSSPCDTPPAGPCEVAVNKSFGLPT